MAELSGSDPLVFFGAFALLIFLGYVGNLIFARFKFNDTVLLIAIGVAVGFILTAQQRGDLESAQSIIGVLALILILFGGGMGLKFHDLLHGVGGASILGLSSFVLTTAMVAAVAWYLLPALSITAALILGAILGGTSALVVMPSLAQMRTEKRTATMLSLESALTDILVVVTTFTLLTLATSDEGLSAGSVGGGVFMLFLVSLAVGALGGILWLWLVPFVREKEFGYMMTLGTAFGLYVFTEAVLKSQGMSEGGGPLAVLAFGIVLGNSTDMWHSLKTRVGDAFGKGLLRFQGELSFLVRTFFFVYLGILVDVQLLQDVKVLSVGVLIFAALAAARYLAVAMTVRRIRFHGDDWVLWCMMPRGLAAAVLAALPVQQGVVGAEPFVAIAFLVLVLSNLTATIGGMVLGGKTTTTGPRRPPGERGARATKEVAFSGKAARKPRKAAHAPAKATTRPLPERNAPAQTSAQPVFVADAPPVHSRRVRPAPALAPARAPTPTTGIDALLAAPPRRSKTPARASATPGPPTGGFKFPPPPVPLSDDGPRRGPPF